MAEATKTKLRPGVPYMLLPVRTAENQATHYPTARADFYLNLGTYTEIDVMLRVQDGRCPETRIDAYRRSSTRIAAPRRASRKRAVLCARLFGLLGRR